MTVDRIGALPEASALPEVWVNGEAAAPVSPLERALHYGDGLFETIACTGGGPRFLDRHLRRLTLGCERLGFEAADAPALRREIATLAGQAGRAIIKVLLSRGLAVARGYAPTGLEKATRITLRYRWPPEDPAVAREGVRVRIASVRLGENPVLAGLKHCNRLEQVLARREWTDPAIAEALMFSSSGALISGTMSNVFIVEDARLYTPRVDRCGVAGVMREVVRDVAAEAGLPVEERVLSTDNLARAEEVFLTSAVIGIRPVRQIAERTLTPGALTRRLQERLAPLLAAAEPGEGAGG